MVNAINSDGLTGLIQHYHPKLLSLEGPKGEADLIYILKFHVH